MEFLIIAIFCFLVVLLYTTLLERSMFTSFSMYDKEVSSKTNHTTIHTSIKNDNNNEKVKDFIYKPTNDAHIAALDSILNTEIPEGYEEV